MVDTSKQWADQARYDLDTARAMFEAGRNLYVLFCCQQAVEKMLKSLITQRTRELPPRVHQLVRLTEVAALQVSEEQMEFLRELSAYYIQTRYPEEIADLGSQVKREQAKRVLDESEGFIKWLNSMV
jgi:HEPN domain-containing protein